MNPAVDCNTALETPYSKLVELLRAIGLERLAWSLRRLHCPVPRDALVLEVGSGGNPYPRSNVLLDAYEHTRERHWVPLTADRPLILGFVENLPFKDKCFDFVIASHVLEHSPYPEKFLSELERVAKGGYIETPDALMERINPYRDHRLEVSVCEGALIVRKKAGWMVDQEIVSLYEPSAKRHIAGETIPRHPFDFHMRYYWWGKLKFNVQNPDVDASWKAVYSNDEKQEENYPVSLIRKRIQTFLRKMLSQNERNKTIDIIDLMRCPVCKKSSLEKIEEMVVCRSCREQYPLSNGHPVMCSEGTRTSV